VFISGAGNISKKEEPKFKKESGINKKVVEPNFMQKRPARIGYLSMEQVEKNGEIELKVKMDSVETPVIPIFRLKLKVKKNKGKEDVVVKENDENVVKSKDDSEKDTEVEESKENEEEDYFKNNNDSMKEELKYNYFKDGDDDLLFRMDDI
jgi:hypothetical protein